MAIKDILRSTEEMERACSYENRLKLPTMDFHELWEWNSSKPPRTMDPTKALTLKHFLHNESLDTQKKLNTCCWKTFVICFWWKLGYWPASWWEHSQWHCPYQWLEAEKNLSNSIIRKQSEKWAKDLNRWFTRKSLWMANKHMKRYSTSLVSRKMQIKATKRNHNYWNG